MVVELIKLKPPTVFARDDERLDHISGLIVAVELVQFGQPEVIAGVVRILASVGIATQVTKELHQHERAIEFLVRQSRIFSDGLQDLPPRHRC